MALGVKAGKKLTGKTKLDKESISKKLSLVKDKIRLEFETKKMYP